ncbi:MAG: hypothetical protein MdMp014T_0812 [Treponematales bacterium]
MADAELIQTLDFILNRCSEGAIDAVAEAVVRRRRELALFGSAARLPDPGGLAKALAAGIDMKGAIDGMTRSVRDYAGRIIRQEAPELSDEQAEALINAWIPSPDEIAGGGGESGLPKDLLAGMIAQFVAFSLNRMDAAEDKALREEMGSWPRRYWDAFPRRVKGIIKDFLNGDMTEVGFNARVSAALAAAN